MPKRIECNLSGHAGEWIERVEKVSVKQWNAWRAGGHDETQSLLLGLIADWNLTGADGQPAPKPSIGQAALDALEIALLPWLIRAVSGSIVEEMKPRPEA